MLYLLCLLLVILRAALSLYSKMTVMMNDEAQFWEEMYHIVCEALERAHQRLEASERMQKRLEACVVREIDCEACEFEQDCVKRASLKARILGAALVPTKEEEVGEPYETIMVDTIL